MSDTRWDLFAVAGVGAIGGVLEAKASAAAAGAVQRSGMVASVEMARQAKRVENLIPAIRLQALQQHNEIVSDFREWASVANSTISYMGRDDRSVDAIRKRVQADTSQTISRVRSQALTEEAKVQREAASLTSAAINERTAADAEAKIMQRQGRASTISTGLSLLERFL
jgi:hypothetical protein